MAGFGGIGAFEIMAWCFCCSSFFFFPCTCLGELAWKPLSSLASCWMNPEHPHCANLRLCIILFSPSTAHRCPGGFLASEAMAKQMITDCSDLPMEKEKTLTGADEDNDENQFILLEPLS